MEKLKIDNEYVTHSVSEMKWLKERNILYSFVKVIDGITTFKYKKSPDLFVALAVFYSKR